MLLSVFYIPLAGVRHTPGEWLCLALMLEPGQFNASTSMSDVLRVQEEGKMVSLTRIQRMTSLSPPTRDVPIPFSIEDTIVRRSHRTSHDD